MFMPTCLRLIASVSLFASHTSCHNTPWPLLKSHLSHLLHLRLSMIEQFHVCLQEKVREVEHSVSQADAAAATTSTALDAETSRYNSSGFLQLWASMLCIGCMHFAPEPGASMHHCPDIITCSSLNCMQVFRLTYMTLSVRNSLIKQAWLVLLFICIAHLHTCV